MNQKAKQQTFLKVFMAFTHTKKVDLRSFIKARIRNRVATLILALIFKNEPT
jgi:hypothetical protein